MSVCANVLIVTNTQNNSKGGRGEWIIKILNSYKRILVFILFSLKNFSCHFNKGNWTLQSDQARESKEQRLARWFVLLIWSELFFIFPQGSGGWWINPLLFAQQRFSSSEFWGFFQRIGFWGFLLRVPNGSFKLG